MLILFPPFHLMFLLLTDENSSFQQRLHLTDLLKFHMKSEELDADNMWECSGCSLKVQALKKLEYIAMPQRLMIHLKRFRYNTVCSSFY